MRPSVLENALADRGDGGQCNMPRIPAGRYPPFSTTVTGTFNAAGVATFEFEAERDMLFNGMSMTPSTAADALTAFADVTYCNTKYLIHDSIGNWARCCERKPIFLVGVRDNKKLEFSVTGGTPAGTVAVTLHGFQGRGCCD